MRVDEAVCAIKPGTDVVRDAVDVGAWPSMPCSRRPSAPRSPPSRRTVLDAGARPGRRPDLGDPPGRSGLTRSSNAAALPPAGRAAQLRAALTSVAEDARHIMVVTDAEGGCCGGRAHRCASRADGLGFRGCGLGRGHGRHQRHGHPGGGQPRADVRRRALRALPRRLDLHRLPRPRSAQRRAARRGRRQRPAETCTRRPRARRHRSEARRSEPLAARRGAAGALRGVAGRCCSGRPVPGSWSTTTAGSPPSPACPAWSASRCRAPTARWRSTASACACRSPSGGWLLRVAGRRGADPRSRSISTSRPAAALVPGEAPPAGCAPLSPPRTPRCCCCSTPTPRATGLDASGLSDALYGDREHLVTVRAEMRPAAPLAGRPAAQARPHRSPRTSRSCFPTWGRASSAARPRRGPRRPPRPVPAQAVSVLIPASSISPTAARQATQELAIMEAATAVHGNGSRPAFRSVRPRSNTCLACRAGEPRHVTQNGLPAGSLPVVPGSTVGIIANPMSGRDIRRLVAQASVFPNAERRTWCCA